jgi:AMP nucleosidase
MTQAENIVAELDRLYTASVERLKAALTRYLADGTAPDPQSRQDGSFAYPEIRLKYRGGNDKPAPRRSFGRLSEPGDYRITVTKPAMFADYLVEQLTFLIEDYDVLVMAHPGRQEIPFPYVLDPAHVAALEEVTTTELARHFPATELAHIGDEIADGLWIAHDETRPLALFDGLRTDFSLARLRHYTGTPVEHFQQYILFTNYHRYVDEFVRYAVSQLGQVGSRFTAVSGAGGIYVEAGDDFDRLLNDSSAWRRHQMPAYHLIAEGGTGITLVNIGVGPSNAKTITDHLAVLRPHCWLMIGHCGGLRHTQRIGDYVLAHAYLRRDKVLDDRVPLEVPIPAIAEVQIALQQAATAVSGDNEDLRRRLRTGTVVSYADRNWELNYSQERQLLSQSRAIAVDMESACVATQGFRMRVPYGVLLCISDKPAHGEIKLPGVADRFYDSAVGAHLRIGLETIALLKKNRDRLHSRKLRALDEPPFR